MADDVITPQDEFLKRMGFDANPFEHTNADLEDRLQDYFVAPPYFRSVYGDPLSPTPCMVFAPRGAGKSAQRRMVEMALPHDQTICVTYDMFSNPRGDRVIEMTLDDHLFNVARNTVVGLLSWLAEHKATSKLSGGQREALRLLAVGLFTTTTAAELRGAVNSLRNVSRTAREFWNDNKWAVEAVVGSIGIAAGGAGGVLAAAQIDEVAEEDPGFHLETLGRIAKDAGVKSIYMLIDRVDEHDETTGSPEAAYTMISSLMLNLRVLELRPFAFKFFLPDSLQQPYRDGGGRPDRVTNYDASWTNRELDAMMAKRLAAFSGGRVDSYVALLEDQDKMAHDLVPYVVWFAQRSPRDLIRLWGRALAEQLRIDPAASRISYQALVEGIDRFCDEQAKALAPEPILTELKRVARIDFTISELASEVYRVKSNAPRARVIGWLKRQLVKQIGEVPVRRGRPQYLYGVVDFRVARAMFSHTTLGEFIARKARSCHRCDAWVLRDYEDLGDSIEVSCDSCGARVAAASVKEFD